MIEEQEYKLEDGTTSYDKNSAFITVSGNDCLYHADDVVVLAHDDGSTCPNFRRVDGGAFADGDSYDVYISWCNLKIYNEPKRVLLKPKHMQKKDEGEHYRFGVEIAISEEDAARGFVDINLDPFRIAAIYHMEDFALKTILKKTLVAGNRGHKDISQDLKDIICAAQRKLEMIEEDNRVFV